MIKTLVSQRRTRCQVDFENQRSVCSTHDVVRNHDLHKIHPCDNEWKKCELYCGDPTEKPENGYYSSAQWHNHNEELLRQSTRGKQKLNVVGYNVQRSIKTMSTLADKNMLASTKGMVATVRYYENFMTTITETLAKIDNEIDLLMIGKKRIQNAQKALYLVCSISTECLERRSFRIDTDFTLDTAQEALLKEKELIHHISVLFCDTILRIEEEVFRLKRIKSELDIYWSRRKKVYDADTKNLDINFQSLNIMPYDNAIRDAENLCDRGLINPCTGHGKVEDVIKEAEQILTESALARSKINNDVLYSSSNKLRDQADEVDMALARCIADTHCARQAIENDLKQTVQRLGKTESAIGDLLRLIKNLEKARMVAEYRLRMRYSVQGDNLPCDKEWEFALISEIKSLHSQINLLNHELKFARTSDQDLQEVRLVLEDESRIKRKTLWTDSIRCQKVRACYPSINALMGR